MICGRCGTENSDGARFCSGCGSPVGTPKQSDPVVTPAAAALPRRQWGVAIISAAAFLLGAGSTLGFAFVLLRSSYGLSSIGLQLVGYLVLGIAGAAGVFSSLRDRKAALTVLAGGMLLRSAIVLLGALSMGPPAMLLLEWFVVGVVSAGVLWTVWKTAPIAAGDAERLTVALTVLLGAEIAAVIFGIALRPSAAGAPYLFAAAAGIGLLVWLRIKLPGAIGAAAAGPAEWSTNVPSSPVNRRLRHALFFVMYIVIAIILRVILRQAFR